MAKIKIGDLVRVKLLNDMYMWVHVLFDSQFIVKGKKEINPYNYPLAELSQCILDSSNGSIINVI